MYYQDCIICICAYMAEIFHLLIPLAESDCLEFSIQDISSQAFSIPQTIDHTHNH